VPGISHYENRTLTAASFLDRRGGGVEGMVIASPAAWHESPRSNESRPPERPSVVSVVDDDAPVRDALSALLGQVGLRTETYDSAAAFVEDYRPGQPGCLILDVRMPGMDGLELQRKLAADGVHLPIIFLTGYGDVPMAVQAMQDGAVTFIMKPFREQILLEAVRQGIDRDARDRRHRALRERLRQRLASLTPRERQVLQAIVGGKQNKAIAAILGLSHKTIGPRS